MFTYPAFLATLVAASPMAESAYTNHAKYASEKVQPLKYSNTNVQANIPLHLAEGGSTQDAVKTYTNPKTLGYEKKAYAVLNEYTGPPEHMSTHSKEHKAYSSYGQENTHPTDEKKTVWTSKPKAKSNYNDMPHSAYSTKPEPSKEITYQTEHKNPETYGKAQSTPPSANGKILEALPSYTKPSIQPYDPNAARYEKKKDETQSGYGEKEADANQGYGHEKMMSSSGNNTAASTYTKKTEEDKINYSNPAALPKSVYSTIAKPGYEKIHSSSRNSTVASSYTKKPEEDKTSYGTQGDGHEKTQSSSGNKAAASSYTKKTEEDYVNYSNAANPPKLVGSSITKPSYGDQGYDNVKSQASSGNNVVTSSYTKKTEEDKTSYFNATAPQKSVYSAIAKPDYENNLSSLGNSAVVSGYTKSPEQDKSAFKKPTAPPKSAYSTVAKASYRTQVTPQPKGLPASKDTKSNQVISATPSKPAKKASPYSGYAPATRSKTIKPEEAKFIRKYQKNNHLTKDTPKYY
ncbi:hypothetical protein DSO57_1036962 [Entomophthora muscae]|uniref:Uncharacterized protein n=1 Tax=Entomophthora muscae TaxID=34485 RepID=A0ACC2TL23_9FUNG|nr:hypothetical protein DSO57_1036962 [Entomophthora muscae]